MHRLRTSATLAAAMLVSAIVTSAAALPSAPGAKPVSAPFSFESAREASPQESLTLSVGESISLRIPGLKAVQVGAGNVLTAVEIANATLLLTGVGEGVTSLLVFTADGAQHRARVQVTVDQANANRQLQTICDQVADVTSVACSVVNGNVVLRGEGLSDSEKSRIAEMAKHYPIVDLTMRVGDQKMICLDVLVVEFPTSVLRDIGIQWSPTGGATVGAIWAPAHSGAGNGYTLAPPTGAPISSAIGAALQGPSGLVTKSLIDLGLGATLSLLQQNGQATMLAQPRLCALSTAKASFLAGGEVPYMTQSTTGPGVVFKTYGVKLDVTPRLESGGQVRAGVAVEVSSIDTSVPSTAGPALATRRTETELSLRAGQTLALSGMLQRTTSTDIQKVPWLGDLPVLGALFRSKSYQNRETELVIFVTPTLTDGASADNVDMKERTEERLRERLGETSHLTDPIRPGMPASAVRGDDPGVMTAGQSLSTVTDAVLRSAPSAAAPALMPLSAGTVVVSASSGTVNASTPDWRMVRVGETVGWLPLAVLAPKRD